MHYAFRYEGRMLSQKSLKLLGVLLLLAPTLASAHTDGIWRIKKDRWSDADEAAYSAFIAKMGESHCNTTGRCFDAPENPYRDQNPSFLKNGFSDCSRLPYMFRLYFAYMNDLPYSYESKVEARSETRDIRYSPQGNKVVARQSVANNTPLHKAISDMMTVTSSAMYRVPPEDDVKGNLFTDFYSVALDRRSIRPGTIIYDPNGHVAMIYKIESDGRVRFMDAHPDNSITRGVYGEKFARSRPTSGAGFKNWRPIVYATNGTIMGRPNAQIADYSLTQFYGTDRSPDGAWKKGTFSRDGVKYDYYDYVRVVLAEGNLRFEPLQEVENLLEALCYDSRDRVASVNEAIVAGVNNRGQPERLPYNIYGTDGDWETYSTPSRDARLKTSFHEAYKKVQQFLQLTAEGSQLIDYKGSVADLKRDLGGVIDNSYASCPLSYKNSAGRDVALNLGDIQERLFDLSFDPYHCVEARWGARGSELASCDDSSLKQAWYKAEQRLRNQMERTYENRMDFNLEELQRAVSGSGVDEAPPVDLRSLLR
ncbi:MAG: hypothetical protein ABIR96_04805 [Bdellovibrionota bacterium]